MWKPDTDPTFGDIMRYSLDIDDPDKTKKMGRMSIVRTHFAFMKKYTYYIDTGVKQFSFETRDRESVFILIGERYENDPIEEEFLIEKLKRVSENITGLLGTINNIIVNKEI